ncbi:MAG TPA: hypothetical protein VHE81_13710, partial [Lacipirellulaceae bacterium]|nr:hypothetical protein [Lacipirellulaceae bacterium]
TSAGAVGRLAPRFQVGAAVMAACFALLFVAIAMVIRPHGKWSVSEQGLRFENAANDDDWQIPWGAISRMKFTSVSLVIWWTEAPVNSNGPSRPHREVLFVGSEQARELIAIWRSRTRTSKQQRIIEEVDLSD